MADRVEILIVERNVLQDVLDERGAQMSDHRLADDDLLEPAEWVARIVKHLGRSVSTDPSVYRKQIVIVGALALAAVEAFDRRVES